MPCHIFHALRFAQASTHVLTVLRLVIPARGCRNEARPGPLFSTFVAPRDDFLSGFRSKSGVIYGPRPGARERSGEGEAGCGHISGLCDGRPEGALALMEIRASGSRAHSGGL